jgi:hypothetical protein
MFNVNENKKVGKYIGYVKENEIDVLEKVK